MNAVHKKLSKTYQGIIIGTVITVLSMLALLLHLNANNEITFDTPALVLLLLALLPWLALFIDNATLPGGWRIEFKKLKAQQEQQESDIDDITSFLFDNFLTGDEQTQLKKLNMPTRFSYSFQGNFEKELRNLLALKLIDRHFNKGIRSAKKDIHSDNDLKTHFFITEKGKWYLSHLDKLKQNNDK